MQVEFRLTIRWPFLNDQVRELSYCPVGSALPVAARQSDSVTDTTSRFPFGLGSQSPGERAEAEQVSLSKNRRNRASPPPLENNPFQILTLLPIFLPLGALWRLLSAACKKHLGFHFSSLLCFASLSAW